MAEDQIIEAIRRRAVLEGNDLAVGPADADIQHSHLGLGGRSELRFRMIDHLDFVLAGKDGDGFHEFRIPDGCMSVPIHFSLDIRLI